MITSPELNVKFTDAQVAQLETFKLQLLGLETDITVHSRTLRNLQTNIVSETRERNFLEEKIKELNKTISGLQVKSDSIERSIEDGKKTVEDAQIEADRLRNLHTATQVSLDQQKAYLDKLQQQIQADRSLLDKKMKQVAEDSIVLENKKKVISEALKFL